MATDAWTNRDWHIVRADQDFSHAFTAETTLNFIPATRNGVQGYTISHAGSDCAKGLFKHTFLQPAGSRIPDLSESAGTDEQLPPSFTGNYDTVLKQIADYVTANDDVLRLVGDVELPAGVQTPDEPKLEFHVYQITNAVSNNLTLLYLQPPLKATSAANGNGTVLGYS